MIQGLVTLGLFGKTIHKNPHTLSLSPRQARDKLRLDKQQDTPHTLSLSKGLNVRVINIILCTVRTRETLRQAQGVRILDTNFKSEQPFETPCSALRASKGSLERAALGAFL